MRKNLLRQQQIFKLISESLPNQGGSNENKTTVFGMWIIILSTVIYNSYAGSGQQDLKRNFVSDSKYVDKIAFYSERNGNADICLMNTGGSGLQRLTTSSARDVCRAISPDGVFAFSMNDAQFSKI